MDVKDYRGFTPSVENWQLQEVDGTPLANHDYTSKAEAEQVARKLSEDYQIVINVKQTYQ